MFLDSFNKIFGKWIEYLNIFDLFFRKIVLGVCVFWFFFLVILYVFIEEFILFEDDVFKVKDLENVFKWKNLENLCIDNYFFL